MEKIEKNFGKKNSIRKNVLEKISKFSKFFFFDFFQFWPHPGVKQAKNDHFWGFQSDPSTRKKVLAEKVKKCLRKIFDKTFFHFFDNNFFSSARIALKLSEMAFFGVFYPLVSFGKKKKKKKIWKIFDQKFLVGQVENFSKFFFYFFLVPKIY